MIIYLAYPSFSTKDSSAVSLINNRTLTALEVRSTLWTSDIHVGLKELFMNEITEHGCLYSAEDKTLTAACKRPATTKLLDPKSTARETGRDRLYRH